MRIDDGLYHDILTEAHNRYRKWDREHRIDTGITKYHYIDYWVAEVAWEWSKAKISMTE